MNRLTPRCLGAAIAMSLAAPAAHAEIALDVIAGSEVSLEGLIQADGNWFDNDVQDLNGNGNNGKDSEFELRRAEIILKGKGTMFDWVVGYDAKADKFLDANLKWKLGSNYLTVGQYKQPNSLEELTSTRHNDFISKAMVTNLFGAGRRVGVAYGDDPGAWGYQVSVFGRELTRNLNKGQGFGGRFYYTPIRESGNILHFGVSAIDHDTDSDTSRWRVRPDADLSAVRLVDTGNLLDTDRVRTYGLEGLWITGPLKVQGEYMRSTTRRTDASSAPDFTGNSWYVYGIWNFTGETWGYKGGLPSTPLPANPGSGMWQLGLRYDKTDLDDGPVLGGEQNNLTVGVNWYWRSNFKLSANYVRVDSTRRDIDDDPNIVEARAQFYW